MQQRHMRPALAQNSMPKHSSACPGCGDVPRASLVIPDLAYLETLDSLTCVHLPDCTVAAVANYQVAPRFSFDTTGWPQRAGF